MSWFGCACFFPVCLLSPRVYSMYSSLPPAGSKSCLYVPAIPFVYRTIHSTIVQLTVSRKKTPARKVQVSHFLLCNFGYLPLLSGVLSSHACSTHSTLQQTKKLSWAAPHSRFRSAPRSELHRTLFTYSGYVTCTPVMRVSNTVCSSWALNLGNENTPVF